MHARLPQQRLPDRPADRRGRRRAVHAHHDPTCGEAGTSGHLLLPAKQLALPAAIGFRHVQPMPAARRSALTESAHFARPSRGHDHGIRPGPHPGGTAGRGACDIPLAPLLASATSRSHREQSRGWMVAAIGEMSSSRPVQSPSKPPSTTRTGQRREDRPAMARLTGRRECHRGPGPLGAAATHRDRAAAGQKALVAMSGSTRVAHSAHHQANSSCYCRGPGQKHPYPPNIPAAPGAVKARRSRIAQGPTSRPRSR